MSDIKHHGVKGQKWGVVRDKTGTAARNVKTAATSDGTKKTLKVVGKTARYGGAAAGIAGITVGGLGVSIGSLGIASALVSDPDVRAVASAGKDYTKLVLNELGVIRISKLDEFKADINVRRTFAKTRTVRTGPS